jgi:transposase-like protein
LFIPLLARAHRHAPILRIIPVNYTIFSVPESRLAPQAAKEKVAVLRRHLLDKVPVSDLCEELGLQPTVFYRWQKEFFENGAAAFQTTERPRRQAEEKQKRIEFLEKKVQTKDEVLAELMAEHIALKKSRGEL